MNNKRTTIKQRKPYKKKKPKSVKNNSKKKYMSKKQKQYEKREKGEMVSKAAKARLTDVYNYVIDAILCIYDAKAKGGIKRTSALNEPLASLYKAKGRIWGITQGRQRIPYKNEYTDEESLFKDIL